MPEEGSNLYLPDSESSVLPLDDRATNWGEGRGSNPQPRASQAPTLPLSYQHHKLEPSRGIEPRSPGYNAGASPQCLIGIITHLRCVKISGAGRRGRTGMAVNHRGLNPARLPIPPVPQNNGASDRTRTCTNLSATDPSSLRVYQFHHRGMV